MTQDDSLKWKPYINYLNNLSIGKRRKNYNETQSDGQTDLRVMFLGENHFLDQREERGKEDRQRQINALYMSELRIKAIHISDKRANPNGR